MEKRRIGVAADDQGDGEAIRDASAESGRELELIYKHDGRQLVENLTACVMRGQRIPDAGLVDPNMPRLNGRQVSATTRKYSQLAQIPLLVSPTSDGQEHMKQCYPQGTNGPIAKGYDFTPMVEFTRDMPWYVESAKGLPATNFYPEGKAHND